MRILFSVFITYLLIVGCSNSYEYKVEGSSGFDVQVYVKPYAGAVEYDFKVNIPYTRDITQYEGEYYKLKVKNLQESGTLRLRIIKYNRKLIFFVDEEDIFNCETKEPYGECKFEDFID